MDNLTELNDNLEKEKLIEAISAIVWNKKRFMVVVLGSNEGDNKFDSALAVKGLWSIDSLEQAFELSKQAIMAEIGTEKLDMLQAIQKAIEEMEVTNE